MEIIYSTVAGLALYILSDWILNRIEIMRGERFPYRSIIFFGIILVLTMGLFGLIQSFEPKPESEAIQVDSSQEQQTEKQSQ